MRSSNQEAAVIRSRPKSLSRKRTRWLWLAVLAVLTFYLWTNVQALERWVPINWFKQVPEVSQLHPIVAASMDKLVAQSEKIGIHILITDDFRSPQDQNVLYDQGRSTAGSIVTQVRGGQSYHNYGLAIDFALRIPGGKVIWDLEYDGNRNGKSDWMEVVSIAKRLGFTWGGDWTDFPDYPHLQMDFGYSIRELQRGWRPSAQPEES
jgi:peptidoglycan L-alanyl-D-glutamate endopeptidase CwlK